MNYLLLAELVTILHVTVIICVLLGILVSVRYKRFRPIEALILVSAVIIWSLYGGCPMTYLESFLQGLAGYPTNIIEVGFIPYYASHWFGISITSTQLNVITYIVATIFFLISIEWIHPFLNPKVFKLRKIFSRTSKR